MKLNIFLRLFCSLLFVFLFTLIFTNNAFAADYATYTAPNTLTFTQDTTTCQLGSTYSVQIWYGNVGNTLIYSKSNPSFPYTIDLSTLGLTDGTTYLASEFCSWGPGNSLRDNTNFTYTSSSSETAPVTTASLATQNPDGSYSDPTTVTLSATPAAGFTVAHTYYIIDPQLGNTQQEYTQPFTVSGTGNHTINYWSVDNNGDQEDVNSQSFSITDFFNPTNVVFNTTTNQMDMDYTGDRTLDGQIFSFIEIYNTTTSGRVVEYENNYGCNTSHCTFTDPVYTNLNNIVPGDNYEVLFNIINPNSFVYTVNPSFINSSTPVTAVNAGGDTQGSYSSDTDYSGGSTFSTNASIDMSGVTNPAPDAVYQSVRYGNFSYTIPDLTVNGTYTVQLQFSEPYWGTSQAGGGGVGSRVFNVSVNGTQVLSDFDVYQAAGGANKAVMEQIPATADSNGNITVTFSSVVDNAMVSGIAVYNGTLPSPTPSPTPTPVNSFAISAGGAGAGSYVADTDYTGGTTYNTSASIDTSGVTNPAPESVYQNVRYGNFSYAIPTYSPNTNYTVRLDFSEPYFNSAGSREFNVSINGTQVLNNFDVYQAAGGENKAASEIFNTTSDSNGFIKIQFNSVVDNAMVSGIQISQQ